MLTQHGLFAKMNACDSGYFLTFWARCSVIDYLGCNQGLCVMGLIVINGLCDT